MKKEQVIAKIRELLPRLMELEKGCIVTLNHFNKDKILFIEENQVTTVDFESKDINEYNLEFNKQIKIIGKEPTILDALECLGNDSLANDYGLPFLDALGYLTYKDKQCSLDLSKTLIKDQSEETINFLHSVLCKK